MYAPLRFINLSTAMNARVLIMIQPFIHFLLKNNHEFTGRINRIGECGGTVHIESKERKEVSSGDFHISEFTIYNKPIICKEDTDFIDLFFFRRVTQYYRNTSRADTELYRFWNYIAEKIFCYLPKKKPNTC
ncbi:MAG: hypothetical protein IPI53_10310 [Saprospiraceae bacterium]|nr:hypothetical protein [Saprospiraceae bacterium]